MQKSFPVFDSRISLETRESSETANDRSGRVANCPHITEPRIGRYGLSAISFLSESVFGDMFCSRVIPTGSGVFREGIFVRLNRLSTCSQYGRCVNLIVPLSISCWTCIPRKYSLSPTSFIFHSCPISSFLALISSSVFDAPKMSSVYVSVRVYHRSPSCTLHRDPLAR